MRSRPVRGAPPEQTPSRAPNGRSITVKDVARRAGVALSSVSRALSGHPDVSPEMHARVIAAANELGYEPDFLARSLRRGRTSTIGFLVRDISNPLFADIVKAAETVFRQAGYTVLLANSDGEPSNDAANIDLFRRRRVDGLILSLASETNEETLRAMASFSGSIVLVDRQVARAQYSAVLSDHYVGVYEAVHRLLALGHQSIGILVGRGDIRASRERLRAYRDAHLEARVPVRDSLIRRGSYARDFGRRETLRLLEDRRPCTAIVAGGIQLTTGLLLAFRERRVAIGADVAVISCDDLELFTFFDPPIAVIARDAAEIGFQAARLLVDALAGAPPSAVTLPTAFIERASVGGPRGRPGKKSGRQPASQ